MDDRHGINSGGVNWLLFVSILLQLLLTYFIIAFHSFFSFEKPSQYMVLLLSQVCTIFLPVVVYTMAKNVDVKGFFRIHRLSGKNVLLVLGLSFCGQFIGQLLNAVVLFILVKCNIPLQENPLPVPQNVRDFMTAVLVLALMPAVFEELLMRGVVIRGYEKRGTKTAAVLSAFLFGIMHLDVKNLLATIFMGLLLAYVVIKTGSILASILMHFTNNLLAVVGYMLAGVSEQVAWLFLICYLVALAAFVPLLMQFKKGNTAPSFLPQKKSLAFDFGRTLFSLPVMLIMAVFVIMQLFDFGILNQ